MFAELLNPRTVMDDENVSKRKIPVAALAAILVLSLATWWFFYAQSTPLDSVATGVVVGIWAGLVLTSRWLWQYIRDRKLKPKEHP